MKPHKNIVVITRIQIFILLIQKADASRSMSGYMNNFNLPVAEVERMFISYKREVHGIEAVFYRDAQ